MGNKKNNKKKNTMVTREQKLAEERALKEKARKRNLITLICTIAVVALLAASLTTLIVVRNTANPKMPGLKRNGKAYETVYVKMSVKDYGDIILKLDGKEAPKTVANFVKLVDEGFYDGLTFHRVINNFMIQGGDPLANGTGGSDKKIKGEFEANGHHNCIAHERGVISMARSNDYNSASSQFFICNASGESVSHLDGNYAAFGHVIAGMNIVDLITTKTAFLATDGNGSIPKSKQAVISSVVVISEEEALSYLD
jgi:peptidyl-prolyl cis-trans isomerase B (cyclophilin B)